MFLVQLEDASGAPLSALARRCKHDGRFEWLNAFVLPQQCAVHSAGMSTGGGGGGGAGGSVPVTHNKARAQPASQAADDGDGDDAEEEAQRRLKRQKVFHGKG